MTHPVFLSYARKTARPHAEALHAALGGETGLAFQDTSDIKSGEQFPAALADAVLGARVVVVFADPTYFRRWYCLRELLITLSPFDALLRCPGTTDAERSAALTPLVIALPPKALLRRNWTVCRRCCAPPPGPGRISPGNSPGWSMNASTRAARRCGHFSTATA